MGERRGTKALEIWCRRCTDGYPGVSVDNMTTSWRDGLAFCALIHRFRPELIEFDRLNPENALYNNELAFSTAERHLGIPALLDAEDMVECHAPDRLSVLTYVAQFYRTFGEASFAMGLISPGRNSPLKRELSEGSPSTPARTSEGEQPPKKNALPAGLARREVCTACGEAVFLAERLRLGGRTFHRRCFRCARCGAQLSPANCYETESRAFCCEVCPDEVRGEFSDEEDDDVQAAAPTEAAASAADVHDEYSVSFESALDDASAHTVTSAPDLDMISAHSSTNQQKHPASPGSGDGTAATATSGGGLVSSRRSLFENLETASGGERRTVIDDKIVAHKDVVTEEDKENRQQEEMEVKVEENIEPEVDEEKKVAAAAFREFLKLDDEMNDDISDTEAPEVPTTEPPVLPKSEPPELPKTEPPPLVNRPEKTEAGLDDESSEVKPTPPLRPPPPISIDNVNSGTVCIPSSASTNDKMSTPDDEATTEKIISSDQKMDETTVPEILVEKVDDEVYPDDLNPFGDEDETPVEKKPSPRRVVSLNPFGSDSEEEEEERKPAPRKLIPVEPSLNPFWEDGEEEEDEPVKTSTPVPRPRSFNADFSGRPSPAPRQSMQFSSSPTGSMRKKKKPPPPPPGTVSANTSPLPSPGGTLNKSRKSRRAPLPPSMAGTPEEKNAKDEANRSMQNNAVAPEKSHEGMWKRKKRPAPGLPIPPRRQIISLPMNEVRKELEMIEVQQRGLEKQGVRLEALIREQLEKTCDAEDEESLPIEAEEMVLQLMDLVMEKNELFRRQAELMYMKRQQRLEEQQVELEWQIRCLLQKPNKDDAELEKEEALIARLVTLVEQRNEIVDCLEMDRKREADEDQSVRERRQMITERHMNPEEKETPKSKAKKLKLKLLQKNKKSKEEKEKSREEKEKSKEEKMKSKEEKKRRKSNGELKVSTKEKDIDADTSSIKSKSPKKKWF